jgi:hypothetical protein
MDVFVCLLMHYESDVLIPFISSLYTCFSYLLRTSRRYKALGQSAQWCNIIKCWIEVGLFLVLHIVYIAYVEIELISAVTSVCCGLPLAIESFSLVTKMTTPLGRDLPSKGLSTFSSYITLFPLCFLSYHCLTDPVHSESEFSAFYPYLSLF